MLHYKKAQVHAKSSEVILMSWKQFFSNFFDEYISFTLSEGWSGTAKFRTCWRNKNVKIHINVILIEELSNI